MKHLKQHWPTTAVVAVILAVGGTVWWQATVGQAAVANTTIVYTPLNAFQRDAVRNILSDIGLDRDAMIALNPTANQAETLLSTVRTWQDDNAATLASLKLTMDRKRHAVRQLEKQIRMGPAAAGRDESLRVARQDLTTARTSRKTAFTSLETSIRSELSGSQGATWTAIRNGHGRTMPIRMLDLTDPQRLAVSHAERTYKRQRAAASMAEERAAAVSTHESAMNRILTNDQKTVVSSYNSNYSTASAAVAGAVNEVLATE